MTSGFQFAPVLSAFTRYARVGLLCLGVAAGLVAQAQTGEAQLSVQASPATVSVMQMIEPAAETSHVELGHTLMLNTRSRVTRIYVANPAVLQSYIVSPHQVLLTAKATGLTAVVLWDEANHSTTYMVSCDLDLALLEQALAHMLPGNTITAEVRQNTILLKGTVPTQAASDAAEKMATLFSKNVVNSLVVNSAKVPQVELKVRFVEVDRSRLSQFGVNLFAPGGTSSSVGSGTTQQFASTALLTSGGGTGLLVGGNALNVSNPLNFLFFSTKAGVGISVQDLENKQALQILAEPTITTLSGRPANFLAGGEFPFPVVQGSSTGTTSITIQFRPYGVRLDFTPQVNPDGSIDLKIAPEVSSLDFTNAVSISGYTIPALSTKHLETEVVLRSGQSFAISGLLDRRTTDALSRTPGIASVPLLGELFRSKNINLSTTELVVVVTPTVVDPLTSSTTPVEPQPVRPFLNPQKFDTGFKPASKP